MVTLRLMVIVTVTMGVTLVVAARSQRLLQVDMHVDAGTRELGVARATFSCALSPTMRSVRTLTSPSNHVLREVVIVKDTAMQKVTVTVTTVVGFGVDAR